MPKQLIIYVDCDEDDVDWLRNKIVPAVEEVAEENAERLSAPDTVDISWDIVDV